MMNRREALSRVALIMGGTVLGAERERANT